MGISPDTLKPKTQLFLLCSLIFLTVARSLYLSSMPFAGDTLNSRLATVVALVHEGRWNIDEEINGVPNPFSSGTVDKVMVDGRVYSSKPPVLPLLMSAEYGLLHHVAGLSLLEEEEVGLISQLLTATFVVLPFALALIGILIWIRTTQISFVGQLLIMGMACYGTEMAGYSGTFNNHVPAAALLILSMAALNRTALSYRFLVLSGLFAGFAATIDIPTAIVAVAIGLGIIRNSGIRGFGFYLLGGALPVLVHSGAMIYLNGSPFPFQMDQSLYWYEAAYWRIPMGIDDLHHAKGTYLFHSTLGRHGVFLLYPITVLGVIGLVVDSLRVGSSNGDDNEKTFFSALFLSSLVILFAYYSFKTNNYGGFSFGFRWMIAGVPVFIWGIVRYFENRNVSITSIVGFLCLGVSVYSVWQCQNAPWSINEEWPTVLYGALHW